MTNYVCIYVDLLKMALRRELAKTQQSHFHAACDGFVGRLKAIIYIKTFTTDRT